MTDPGPDNRFEEEIRHLRALNRRYRELIQSLSSRIEIIRNQTEKTMDSGKEYRAFEEFDVAMRPRPGTIEINEPVLANGKLQIEGHGDFVESKPLIPNPGWKCLAVDQPQIRIGFTLFGMRLEAIEDAVAIVEQRQVRSRDFTPVFVTDNVDFRPFRTRGYVVEYIPESITLKANTNRSLDRYLSARLELIQAKWALGEFVDLGRAR